MAKARIGILSLGCTRNLVDSEGMLGRLNLSGYPIVDIDKADIAIVNTCAFIQDAKSESIDAILDLIELKRSGRLRKIIVCGCLSQRYADKLRSELPEVDAFVGRVRLSPDKSRFSLTPGHYAYLKICEGCINNCSYCIIPKIKPDFESLSPADILKKVREWNSQKLSEINIIGQDITGYGLGPKNKSGLTALLKKIVRDAGSIGWIRLLYLYPSRIDDDLLEFIRDNPRVCKYIDMPLQHINDRVLKLMNRGTARKDMERLIARIRKTIPDVALRTCFIVGFPSETDKEFEELLEFCREMKFERLGAFAFSREEGTPAYKLPGQVPARVKEERFNRIMTAQQEISCQVNRKFLGRAIDVLVEEKKDDCYLGRSQYDAPEVDGLVYIRSKEKLRPGEFVRVKITDTLEYDLTGEVINEHRQ
ncbi:MAG: MiaB/RimO family radical SAM methylthiotransferase [Candidatus Omnitrophica bacterium]|nr:MiaB/RimO family radical SAM methylthiotransferase [Candidatus Omnitrophota bacterium]